MKKIKNNFYNNNIMTKKSDDKKIIINNIIHNGNLKKKSKKKSKKSRKRFISRKYINPIYNPVATTFSTGGGIVGPGGGGGGSIPSLITRTNKSEYNLNPTLPETRQITQAPKQEPLQTPKQEPKSEPKSESRKKPFKLADVDESLKEFDKYTLDDLIRELRKRGIKANKNEGKKALYEKIYEYQLKQNESVNNPNNNEPNGIYHSNNIHNNYISNGMYSEPNQNDSLNSVKRELVYNTESDSEPSQPIIKSENNNNDSDDDDDDSDDEADYSEPSFVYNVLTPIRRSRTNSEDIVLPQAFENPNTPSSVGFDEIDDSNIGNFYTNLYNFDNRFNEQMNMTDEDYLGLRRRDDEIREQR